VSEDQRPVLRVVAGGEPSDEELVALVAVVAGLSGAAEQAPQPEPQRWPAGERPAHAWGRTGWVSAARRSALRRPL
jgi:hypothetical protein